MEQLEKYYGIQVELFDQNHYFQALLESAYLSELLAPERLEGLQLELVELLGKQTERYTNGESSSVPIEKAKQILESITYCIGLYLKMDKALEEQLDLLRSEKMSTLFYQGMEAASNLKDRAAKLYSEITGNLLKINNYSYQDTLTSGIALFFQSYNIEFESFEIPCDIDYQLCIPEIPRLGVEWIYEYLRRLTLENEFLRRFSIKKINQLLQGFHKDSEHMLINVFELVLTNLLGRSLLGLNFDDIDISPMERKCLQERLLPLSKEEIINKLSVALEEIGTSLNLDIDIIIYAKELIPQLTQRIRHNLTMDTLKEIFISFDNGVKEQEIFIDGIVMEDEKLRALIEELREFKSVTQKMDKILEAVRSFRDLVELLEECFYEEEYIEVFNLLTEKEKNILYHIMMDEAGVEYDEDYLPSKQWQRVLHHTYRPK